MRSLIKKLMAAFIILAASSVLAVGVVVVCHTVLGPITVWLIEKIG